MSKQVYYRQCHLKRDNKDGSFSEQTSYIPEPYCVKGKVLKLRDSEGVWENGWVVEFAGEHRRLDEDLPDVHKEIRGHRNSTGDSDKYTTQALCD